LTKVKTTTASQPLISPPGPPCAGTQGAAAEAILSNPGQPLSGQPPRTPLPPPRTLRSAPPRTLRSAHPALSRRRPLAGHFRDGPPVHHGRHSAPSGQLPPALSGQPTPHSPAAGCQLPALGCHTVHFVRHCTEGGCGGEGESERERERARESERERGVSGVSDAAARQDHVECPCA
jgi:hypothetical protein